MNKIIRNFIIIIFMSLFTTNSSSKYNKLAYDFDFNDINGKVLNLSTFKNKIIVVVNVASKCGFTKQYEDMQVVWEKYQSKGLIVLGVPSNDFGNQEPGSSKDIKDFCSVNFGITFPMTEKVIVKGPEAHPFYLWAKKNYGNSAVPKWNFHKIVIGQNGKVIDTFASITSPTSKRFIAFVEQNLK